MWSSAPTPARAHALTHESVDQSHLSVCYPFPRACVHACSAGSKYALFVFDLSSFDDGDIDTQCVGRDVKRVEWVSVDKLLNDAAFKRKELHEHAHEMVVELLPTKLLQRLGQVFDGVAELGASWAAARPAPTAGGAAKGGGGGSACGGDAQASSNSASAFGGDAGGRGGGHWDVLERLRAAAAAATTD